MGQQVSTWLGLALPSSCAEAERLTGVLSALARAPGVPAGWCNRDNLTRLIAESKAQADKQDRQRVIVRFLSEWAEDELPDLDLRRLQDLVQTILAKSAALSDLLGSDWDRRLLMAGAEIAEKAKRLVIETESAIRCTSKLLDLLGGKIFREADRDTDAILTVGMIGESRRLAATVHSLCPVPSLWVDGYLDSVERDSVLAVDAARQLEDREQQLFEIYHEEVMGAVDRDTLVRYKTDYQSFFGRLRSQFRRDQRSLKGLRKTRGSLNLNEAIHDIEAVLEVNSLRADWEKLDDSRREKLGRFYQGRNTDWPAVSRALEDSRAVVATLGNGSDVRRALTDIDIAEEINETQKEVAARWDRVESLARGLVPVSSDYFDANARPDAVAIQASAVDEPIDAACAILEEIAPLMRKPLESIEVLSSVLEQVSELRRLKSELESDSARLRADFETRFDGAATAWDEIENALSWTEDLLSSIASASHELAEHATEPQPSENYDDAKRQLSNARELVLSKAEAVSDVVDPERLPWRSWGEAPLDELIRWAEDLSLHAHTASDWLQYCDHVRELEGRLGAEVIGDIRAVTPRASEVPPVIERRLLGAWLECVCGSDPSLRGFVPKDHASIIEEFCQLDRALPTASVSEIRRRLFARYPDPFVTVGNAGQLGLLYDQLSRKRKQLAGRKLFTRIPEILQALKPCLMMSPLAVSQFLARSASMTETIGFDAVIFDEASQVFPEDAIPSIERADQVIVVGDAQQLPPTTFFRRAMEEDDNSDDDDDVEQQDAFEGRDSILEVMQGMRGRGVAERYLQVHYRSRHDSLIRFSNHFFYDDRLMVFPSPEVERSGVGIRDVYLAEGRYDAGGTRTNQRESEQVVDLVYELARTIPIDESIGVVALSRTQADLIEFLLEQRRISEPDIEFRFTDTLDEPLFVKNLENVQGDERDHIILSIGYGPTTGPGAVPNRFGPINAVGGHRRLNVAVSRARRTLTLVHSLRASDVRSEQHGAKLLRRYLEYAENPVTALDAAQSINDAAETESDFEHAVLQALTARGHEVKIQVGVAGYRIDLGILSEDGTRFDLGIECDGLTYHSCPAARDRDWLRQTVLEGLGWNIHRIWSTAWIRNKNQEIIAIENALERARSRPKLAISQVHLPMKDLPPDDESRTAVSGLLDEPSRKLLFEEYQQASLTGFPRGPELQYEVHRLLEPMILEVARVEGLVHFDVLIDRLRTRYDMSRARQASRQRVWSSVKRCVETGLLLLEEGNTAEDSFLSLPDCDSTIPRRSIADARRRVVTQISTAELQSGVDRIVRVLFGASREELIRETSRQFGYERAGEDIHARIGETIDRMLADGRLVPSFDTLRAAGGAQMQST